MCVVRGINYENIYVDSVNSPEAYNKRWLGWAQWAGPRQRTAKLEMAESEKGREESQAARRD